MSIAEPEIRQLPKDARSHLESGGVYATIKPALDYTMALILLVLTAPVMMVAIMLVLLTSRGPAIYRQRRMGRNGEVFTIYKIRTMYQDSERHSGATWSLPGDPRVTPLGRVLRLSHLDELPQLINVLMGEMSLVGPRPERPEFLPRLERVMPEYRRRLDVRPGVTGLAQVQQPPDVDLISVRRKLDYDLRYVESMNFWLDVRIVLATALKCAGIPFAWIGTLLMLPDPGASPGREAMLREAELAPESLA